MAELMTNIAASAWLFLAVIAFVRLHKWNKRFSEMYEELKHKISEEFEEVENG